MVFDTLIIDERVEYYRRDLVRSVYNLVVGFILWTTLYMTERSYLPHTLYTSPISAAPLDVRVVGAASKERNALLIRMSVRYPKTLRQCLLGWSTELAHTVRRRLRYRAPRYVADCCVPVSEVSGRQHIRSASRRKLNIPQLVSSRHIWHSLRAFSVAGPTVWNSLPDSLRDPAVDSERFRRDLKTHLFAFGH